jgi:hypothetical protein
MGGYSLWKSNVDIKYLGDETSQFGILFVIFPLAIYVTEIYILKFFLKKKAVKATFMENSHYAYT